MFLRRFRQTGPDIIIMIFIISVLVWLASFIHPQQISPQSPYERPMPLFGILLKITYLGPFVTTLFAFILVQLIEFLLVSFNTSDFFIEERTFLPALLYVLIGGIFIKEQTLNPALPAAIFLIMGSRRIMDSYKVQGVAGCLFDAGLWIGTGSLFYFNLIWFGPLLIIGIALLRTGSPKEIIISLLGLLTPLFLVYGVLYISGKDFAGLVSDAGYNLFGRTEPYKFSVTEIVALITVGIVFIMSMVKLLPSLGVKKIRSRKTFNLLIWTLIISGIVYYFSRSASVELIWLAAIPSSFIITHYFVFAKGKLIPEILFLALFMAIAAVQILART